MPLLHVRQYGVVLGKRFVGFSIWRYMGRKMKRSFLLRHYVRPENISLHEKKYGSLEFAIFMLQFWLIFFFWAPNRIVIIEIN
jgi:hypothetical protein